MTTRKRKEHMQYDKYRKQKPVGADCDFCTIGPGNDQFIEEGKYFKVIINKFHYTYWDEQDVAHQVMLVPKQHVSSLKKLPTAAAAEFLEFIGKYEEKGYNVYARAPESPTKSVPHQHTHLIKTEGPRKKLIIFSKKPFMLFMR